MSYKLSRLLLLQLGATGGIKEVEEFCRKDTVILEILKRRGFDTNRKLKITYDDTEQELHFSQEESTKLKDRGLLGHHQVILDTLVFIMDALLNSEIIFTAESQTKLFDQCNLVRKLK